MKRNNILSGIMLIVFLFTFSSQGWAKAELTKIRVGQSSDKTRIVFDIKKNHSFKIFKLSHPARIVVDFYKTTNHISFTRKTFLDKQLKRIRIKNQKKRTRIVLDLRKNLKYHYFTLGKNASGAERVVLDLSKTPSRHAKGLKPTRHVKVALVKTKKSATRIHKTNHKQHVKLSFAKQASHRLKKKTQKNRNKFNPLLAESTHELVVAIDAGHGGRDTGAIGSHHTYEKTVTLALAKKLKRYIDKQQGMRAVLTRTKDVYIPLAKRVQIAHRKQADIFISLHADSFPSTKVQGGSVYVLSTRGASSVMARILAKSENASLNEVKLRGRENDVAFVLSDLTREANIRASRKLGHFILGSMGRSVKLHKDVVQSADFAVLKSIDMPSLLIETAFISNPAEEKRLKNSKFQTKVALSIVSGLTKFVKRNSAQPRWGEKLYVHYRVQPGDTLSEIAQNYIISVRTLKKLNRLHSNQLDVGRRLKIPVSEKMVASL